MVLHYTVKTNLHPKMCDIIFRNSLRNILLKKRIQFIVDYKLMIGQRELSVHGNLVVTDRADAGNPIADSCFGAIM